MRKKKFIGFEKLREHINTPTRGKSYFASRCKIARLIRHSALVFFHPLRREILDLDSRQMGLKLLNGLNEEIFIAIFEISERNMTKVEKILSYSLL